MSTKDLLIKEYGPLLSLEELSKVLKRSPDGLRIALRSQTEFARKWSTTRLKIGRRVYFRSADIANLIDGTGRDIDPMGGDELQFELDTKG